VLLSVEAARPPRCPNCLTPARSEGRIVLHGHGVRWRTVVLANDRECGASIARIWSRRFRCCRCETCCAIAPPGVVPRHLYGLGAIVTAWLLALAEPLGEGLDQLAVCARQGVDRRGGVGDTEPGRSGRRRWRSLGRWAARIGMLWPTRPVSGTTWRQTAHALLVGFVAGGGGRDGLRARAIAAHASSGGSM
jgi:hypothetical protein